LPITNSRVVEVTLEFWVGYAETNTEAVSKAEKELSAVPGKIKRIVVTTNA